MKQVSFFMLLVTVSASADNISSAAKNVNANDEKVGIIADTTLHHIDEVYVTGLTGKQRIKESPAPVSVVTREQLQMLSSTNIIDALSHQPGLSQITTGCGISKPVIRGLGYNRVAVVSDGIRQEGQQWGDEHGLELDGAGVSSVEILKGPASLMYGSDAMAGVLIFHNDPLQPEGEMKANVSSGYQTNNGLFDYSLNFAGNRGGLQWNLRGSEKMSHAYKNSYDGYVPGSQYRERALSGVLGMNRRWGYAHLTLDYYHLTPGIVEGERDAVTGMLTPPYDGYDLKTYGKALPFQQVHHYKAVVDNTLLLGNGDLKFVVGYQQNRRQEFEESRTTPGLDFMLHTLNYDVRYVVRMDDGWKLSAGANGMYQRSLNEGDEYLIPAYHLFDMGTFVTASKGIRRWDFSGGARFDVRHVHGEQLGTRFADIHRTFTGVTGSLGAIYHASDKMDVRINIARGFRTPNMSELASNGVHEGSVQYEIGNGGLKPEFSWQGDLGVEYANSFIDAGLSVFANRIENYIFLSRLAGVTTEGYATYQYTSGNALLMGGEASIDVHPFNSLHFKNAFSYVNARQLSRPEDSRYLPFIPAPRFTSELRYSLPDISRSTHLGSAYVSVNMECCLRQNHFYAAAGTETATPSYTLLGAMAGADIIIKNKKIASLYLSANNILDRAYQSHLSRLKYADVNVVTGRQGVYNMGRNIGVRVVVPIDM